MTRLDKARRTLRALPRAGTGIDTLGRDMDMLRAQLGGLESRLVAQLGPGDFSRAEFRAFSQWGEDGMIQFLVQRIPIDHEVFVEFGVEDYRESNTRFLLVNDNWRGLIIDGDSKHVSFVHASGLQWQHHIDAVTAFIDRDNINRLMQAAGIEGDIGLLSVDIDGNDYWVLEAIDVVSPRILVVEYNSVFGPTATVSVPYRADFARSEAHWSWLYFGASLAAFAHLADAKGYGLVGCNRAGNNAFFVRRDVIGDLPELTAENAWVASRFRESRGADRSSTHVSELSDRLAPIADLPVVDVVTNETMALRERVQY